jgi:hypothetical protein
MCPDVDLSPNPDFHLSSDVYQLPEQMVHMSIDLYLPRPLFNRRLSNREFTDDGC